MDRNRHGEQTLLEEGFWRSSLLPFTFLYQPVRASSSTLLFTLMGMVNRVILPNVQNGTFRAYAGGIFVELQTIIPLNMPIIWPDLYMIKGELDHGDFFSFLHFCFTSSSIICVYDCYVFLVIVSYLQTILLKMLKRW
ncbi:hypothetical protein ACJX0J_022590, partial [Zea mays]